MTPARLAFITQIGDQIAFNLQLPEGESFPPGNYMRAELNKKQLANIVVEGARMLLHRMGPEVRCARVDDAMAAQLRKSIETNAALLRENERLRIMMGMMA